MKDFTQRIYSVLKKNRKSNHPFFYVFQLLLKINKKGLIIFTLYTFYETLLNIQRISEILKADVISKNPFFNYIILDHIIIFTNKYFYVFFWSIFVIMSFILIFGLFIGILLKNAENSILDKVEINSYFLLALLHLLKIIYVFISKPFLVYAWEITLYIALVPSTSILASIINPLCFVLGAILLITVTLLRIILFNKLKYYRNCDNLAWTSFNIDHDIAYSLKKVAVAIIVCMSLNPNLMLVYIPLSYLSLKFKINNRGFEYKAFKYILIMTEMVEVWVFIISYLSYIDILSLTIENAILFTIAGFTLSTLLMGFSANFQNRYKQSYTINLEMLYYIIENVHDINKSTNKTFLLGYLSYHMKTCHISDCSCQRLAHKLKQAFTSLSTKNLNSNQTAQFTNDYLLNINTGNINGSGNNFYNPNFWYEFWIILINDTEKNILLNANGKYENIPIKDFELFIVLSLIKIDLVVFKLNKTYFGLNQCLALNNFIESHLRCRLPYYKFLFLKYNLFLLEKQIKDTIIDNQKNNLTYIVIFNEIILFNNHYEAFLDALINTTKLTREFFSILQEHRDKDDLKLFNRFKDICAMISQSQNKMIENFEILNKHHSEEYRMYFLYSKFFETIYLLPHLKKTYLEKFEFNFKMHLTDNNINNINISRNNKIKIFSKKSNCGVCIVSGDVESIGSILYTNNVLEDLVKYKKEALLRKNVNMLMSHLIGKYHNHFIKNFYTTNSANILDEVRQVFLKCKQGFLVYVNILIKVLPNFTAGISFISFVNRTSLSEGGGQSNYQMGYIVCNNNHIVGISKEIFYATKFSSEFIPPTKLNDKDSELNHIDRIFPDYKNLRNRMNDQTYEEIRINVYNLPEDYEIDHESSDEEKLEKDRYTSSIINSQVLNDKDKSKLSTISKNSIIIKKSNLNSPSPVTKSPLSNTKKILSLINKSPREKTKDLKNNPSYLNLINNFSKKEKQVIDKIQGDNYDHTPDTETLSLIGRNQNLFKSDNISDMNSLSVDSEQWCLNSLQISNRQKTNALRMMQNIEMLKSIHSNTTNNIAKISIDKLKFYAKKREFEVNSIHLKMDILKVKIYLGKTETEENAQADTKKFSTDIKNQEIIELDSNTSMSMENNQYLELLHKKDALSHGGLLGRQIRTISTRNKEANKIFKVFEGVKDIESREMKVLHLIYALFTLSIIGLIIIFSMNFRNLIDRWYNVFRRKAILQEHISFMCNKIEIFSTIYTTNNNILVNGNRSDLLRMKNNFHIHFSEGYFISLIKNDTEEQPYWDSHEIDSKLIGYLNFHLGATDRLLLTLLDIPKEDSNDKKHLFEDNMEIYYVDSQFNLKSYKTSFMKQCDYYDHSMRSLMNLMASNSTINKANLFDFNKLEQRLYFEILYNTINFMSKYIYDYMQVREIADEKYNIEKFEGTIIYISMILGGIFIFAVLVSIVVNNIQLTESYVFKLFFQLDPELIEYRKQVVDEYYRYFVYNKVIHNVNKSIKNVLIKEVKKLHTKQIIKPDLHSNSNNNLKGRLDIESKPTTHTVYSENLLEKASTINSDLDEFKSYTHENSASDQDSETRVKDKDNTKQAETKEIRKLTREMCKLRSSMNNGYSYKILNPCSSIFYILFLCISNVSFFVVGLLICMQLELHMGSLYSNLKILLDSQLRSNIMINEIYNNSYIKTFNEINERVNNKTIEVDYKDKLQQIANITSLLSSSFKKFDLNTLNSNKLTEKQNIFAVAIFMQTLKAHSDDIGTNVYLNASVCDFYKDLSKTIGDRIVKTVKGPMRVSLLNNHNFITKILDPENCMFSNSENIFSLFTHIDKHLFQMKNDKQLDFENQENFDIFYSITILNVYYIHNILKNIRSFITLIMIDNTAWFKDLFVELGVAFVFLIVGVWLFMEIFIFRMIFKKIFSCKSVLVVLPMDYMIRYNPDSKVLHRLYK